MDVHAAVALARLGLGRRSGEPVPADPRAWALAQLDAPDPIDTTGLPATADGLALTAALFDAAKRRKQAAAPDAAAAARPDPADDPDPARQRFRAQVRGEQHNFVSQALATPAPFRERLVWFWSNHFTVAARTRVTAATAGAYVREAIRPHVSGRFTDMLLAVMRHPAMLAYLDQAHSMGPDSRAGARRHGGLNENLARECLELHTVTPAAGYTQADVTAFARVLTGWSFELRQPPLGFVFRPNMHAPGDKVVMRRTWPEGEAGGVELLTWLSTHPATTRHLALKLVRHFAADDPDPADVARIDGVLRDTGGDLGAASRALLTIDGVWKPLAKLRTPMDYVVASLRTVGATGGTAPKLVPVLAELGQPVFGAPFPIGWPDRAADWAGPEAMLQRIDFAYGLAGSTPDIDPMACAEAQLGPLVTPALADELRAAGSRRDALTLLLASPAFQRR